MAMSNSRVIAKSMLGLSKIKATQFDTTEANIGIINGVTNINGKAGQDLVIEISTVDDVVINNDVQINDDLTVDGDAEAVNLHVLNSATVDNDLHVLSDATVDGDLQAGEILIRDETYPNDQYIRMYYNRAGLNGFLFELMAPHQIMYFMVRDQYNNKKALQFSYSQMYTNINFVMESSLIINGGSNKLQFMDNDLANIWLVPVSNPWDGLRITTNYAGYAINHYNMNLSSSQINTFRTQYNLITSLVAHQFDGNIVVNGVSLTPTMVSYLNNCTSNIQSQLNGKLSTSGGTISGILTTNGLVVNFSSTLKGDVILNDGTTLSQAELGYLDGITSSVQTQLNSLSANKLNISGGTISGILTTNGLVVNFDATLKSNVILNDGTTLSQSELSYLNNVTSNIQTQLNSKASLTGGDISVNNLTFTNATGGYLLLDNLLMTVGTSANFNCDVQLNANVVLFGGTILSQSELSYLNNVTSNIQTQLDSKYSTSTTAITLNNLTVNTASTLSGTLTVGATSTFNASALFNSAIDCKGSLSLSSTSSPSNKIIQNIISGDISGQSNTLKYTQIKTNHGFAGGTLQPVLQLIDDNNSNAINLYPNLQANAYNNINTTANTKSIIAQGTSDNSIFTITNHSTQRVGMKLTTLSSSTAKTELFAGNTSLTLDLTTGASLTSKLSIDNATASNNRITQNIISGDVGSNNNVFKYSVFQIDSNTGVLGSTQYALRVIDSVNSNSISFFPNNVLNGFNSISGSAGTRMICGTNNADTNMKLAVTNNATIKNGLLITNNTVSHGETLICSAGNEIKTHNTNGITLTNTAGNIAITTSAGNISLTNGSSSITMSSANTSMANVGTIDFVSGRLGTIYQASITTTAWVSGIDQNVSTALSLPAGTYSIHWICTFKIINGSVYITAYASGWTTSTSGFTDILHRGSVCNTINQNEYISSSASTVATFASTTNIYLRANIVFTTANRMEVNAGASSLRAIRIA
jgi:hypothetical protein